MRYIQAFLKKILFLQKCDATTKQNQKEYTKGYKKTPPIGGVLSESGSWGTRTFQLQLCISISFTLIKTSFCSIFVAKLPNL